MAKEFLLTNKRGLCVVVSGPSGSGKTTICQRLVREGRLDFSVSCTTRKKRKAEIADVDYHFISKDEFEAKVEAGEFLEYALVHGEMYGTLKQSVVEAVKSKRDILLDIDVQGAEQLRKLDSKLINEALVTIFLMPPTIEELSRRLDNRNSEDSNQKSVRIKKAISEIKYFKFYRYSVRSGSHQSDYAKVLSIIAAERTLTRRQALISK